MNSVLEMQQLLAERKQLQERINQNNKLKAQLESQTISQNFYPQSKTNQRNYSFSQFQESLTDNFFLLTSSSLPQFNQS